jgi:DNA-binding transcriptional LysR family regulator
VSETISLDLLERFIAVAEAGSFTAAASKLGEPKSSVSRAIAALEEELDVRLFHRTTRQVSLSTAGAALLEKIAPLVAELRASLGAVPEREEQPSGLLKVTASNDLGVTLLPVIVARFAARYPLVEVDVRLTNAMVDLVADGVDVALRISARGRLADSTLAARQATTLSAALYAAPSYLARRGAPRTPAELDGHDWVVFRHAEAFKLEGGGSQATVRPRGRVAGDDMLFVLRAAREGLGLGFLPTFLTEADVAAGSLVRVLPRWASKAGTLWFVTPSARQQPKKVTAFRHVVLETLGECPE